jgi:GT2 family glycosyltransferase
MSNNYFNYKPKYPENTVTMEVKQEEKAENDVVEGLTSIIIPAHLKSYPLFHMTGNCIGSIREHTSKEATPYELILVLNGKPISEFKDYSETYCDKVIPLDENEGYSRAVNKGIRASSGEYIAIINNDVQVFDSWLSNLKACLIAGLDLVMATPMYGMAWARAVESRELTAKHEGEFIEDSFSGFRDFSCILTRRSLFDKIGLFGEQFFAYGEDLDLFKRMDQEGLKYASTKLVNTTHIIGATGIEVPEIPEIMNQSRELLKKKWGE